MPTNILVVDDSAFFRRCLTGILHTQPDFKVVGTAANGREAIDLVAQLRPDVVTMDVMMPVLDGIAAVKAIMHKTPTPILMFSASTTEGATATLNALEAGAADFLPKRFEEIATGSEDAKAALCARVRALAERRARAGVQAAVPVLPARGATKAPEPALANTKEFKLVVIGSSTGGPMALQKVLIALPATFPVPILMVQHMPANFTTTFADRLNQLCRVSVKEAADGDILQPGSAYLAPGGRQMVLQRHGTSHRIRIIDGEAGLTYRPCVDVTLNSVATECRGLVLTIILTGMGSDGCAGARALKQQGGRIWAQDEGSSVVYGMPMAIANAGLADRVLPLDEIGPLLAKGVA